MKAIIKLSLILALFISFGAQAASRKTITRTIDASNLDKVEFQISVAEIEIEVYDGDEIQLDIELEADRNWLSLRRGDVDHVELEVRERDSTVRLRIEEDDLDQHWRVKLPAKLAVDLEVGVGDIRIVDFSNSLDMELGVGAVRVETDGVDYGNIHLSAGVGDTSIRGFRHRADQERSFISSDTRYNGDGELTMDIEVGVGDVEVRGR